MSDIAIQTEGLRKVYRSRDASSVEALKSLDLEIPRGAIFGLLGPNGAGKSTFINILAGLVLKSSGKVRICGFDQDVEPRQSRASIGVMTQEVNIDPFLRPLETIDVQAGLYGVNKSKRNSLRVLQMVGLSRQRNDYARSLSGGMKRRLMMAKALAHNPQILVLDEPTAGVDIELRRQLWDNVRRLNRDGTTVVLTTHYLEEAEELCDSIAIIDKGELIACDSTANLVEKLDRKLLHIFPVKPVTDNAIPPQNLPQNISMNVKEDGSLTFLYPRSKVSFQEILTELQNVGIEIKDIASEEPSLTDVFISLTSNEQG